MSEVNVFSDVNPDGGYGVSVEFGEDLTRPLDRDSGWRYAQAVMTAAQRAAYDAAVVRQLRGVADEGMPVDGAAKFVAELRGGRPPLPGEDTAPLRLEPGVSAFTGEPFLMVFIDGEAVGQWSVDDAQQHALHVLECLAAVDLDAQYHAFLRRVGMPEHVARSTVGDLMRWRAGGETSTDEP